MGTRGPIPKRSESRRRRNKPEQEIKKAPRQAAKVPCPECSRPMSPGAGMTNHRRLMHDVAPGSAGDAGRDPDHPGRYVADPSWHRIATLWYDSLPASGQHVFYEPSDWATAYLVAESISRELEPRAIFNESGEVVTTVSMPPKGASLSAWFKAMSTLLVTEGDRRRMQIELQQPSTVESDQPAPVTDMRSWRENLNA